MCSLLLGTGDNNNGDAVELALTWYERGAQLGSFAAMYSCGYLLLRKAIKALHECDEFIHTSSSTMIDGILSEGVCMLEAGSDMSEGGSERFTKSRQTCSVDTPIDSGFGKPPLAKRSVSLSLSALSTVSDNIHVKQLANPLYHSHNPSHGSLHIPHQRAGNVDHDMTSVCSVFSVSAEREKAYALARLGKQSTFPVIDILRILTIHLLTY